MRGKKHIKLFRNGRDQVVCIPAEFELAGDEAIIYGDGGRLVIEPVHKRGLALLQVTEPVDEDFPEIDDVAPSPQGAP